MERYDAFSRQYHQMVLGEVTLPEALWEHIPVSYLKEGTRTVLLTRTQSGEMYVVKSQPVGQALSLGLEYEILRSVNHPQIPQAVCFLEEKGTEYLVREYVPGLSLAELVAGENPVDERRCLSIILSLCRVISHLHAHTEPIIHRDIKPQNVILSPEGVCHLIDFGTARHYKENLNEDTLYVGTRLTAPPEQFGYGQTDARSDIFSIGMLMRYLLTGDFKPLSGKAASRGLRQVIGRCTAFDPRKRLSSAQSLSRRVRLLQHRGAVLGAGCAIVALLVLLCLPFSSSQNVQFTNPLLAQAVRGELGLAQDAAIPREFLAKVTKLIICGQERYASLDSHQQESWLRHDESWMVVYRGSIDSLEELTGLVNLRELVLDYQNIEDISPLQGMPLERVSLVGNRIADISPLASCKGLTEIILDKNPIVDVAPLANLPGLMKINADDTLITSIDALSGTSIQKLSVANTSIVDYGPLRTMKSLQELAAKYLDQASLAVVTGVPSLRKLALHNCVSFEDFSMFAQLKNLQELDIAFCTFDRVDGLALLPGLRFLNLSHTGITELTGLPALSALTHLELRGNEIADFSPLLHCPRLVAVVLDEAQRAQAEAQLAKVPFALEIRRQ